MNPTPENLLEHTDSGMPWPSAPSALPGFGLDQAYALALRVRALRIARGESPQGYKVGFTNRGIWARYQVFEPIWGTVWDSTVEHCDGVGSLSLDRLCQPRIEPEAVFGLREAPPRDADLDQLWACLDWVAPGFEIVQSHLPDWKFQVTDTVADSGLHGRLLVGRRTPVSAIAPDAVRFDARLAAATVSLMQGDEVVEQGQGRNVLDGPLRALWHFVHALARQPGGPWLQAGDVVTTGTWTDAWPVAPGQTWRSLCDDALPGLEVRFS